MNYTNEIAALRTRAAECREESLSWITVDGAKGRRLIELAERFEERATLLEAAGKVGAPATYQQFRRHFLRAGNL